MYASEETNATNPKTNIHMQEEKNTKKKRKGLEHSPNLLDANVVAANNPTSCRLIPNNQFQTTTIDYKLPTSNSNIQTHNPNLT